jgi:hypothetical protein
MVSDLGDRQRLELPRGTGSYETRGWISDLRYSPRGDLLAFIEHQSREDETGLLVVFDPRRGEKKVLTNGRAESSLACTSSGAFADQSRSIL